MNKESIEMLKRTYGYQKPVYKLNEQQDLKEKEVIRTVMQNTQRCCADILRLLCIEYIKNPECKDGKYFKISTKIYYPDIRRSRNEMLCDEGELLAKLSRRGAYGDIGLYCEILNGKENFYPVMVNLVSRELGYLGIDARLGALCDFTHILYFASIDSIVLGKLLEQANADEIVPDEEKPKHLEKNGRV